MVEACLSSGSHCLGTTGEEPVYYHGLETRDEDARSRGVMLLPEVGFDILAASMASGI